MVETARDVAGRAGWPEPERSKVVRAAWYHDAVKAEPPEAWVRRIVAAGDTPDPWALAHGPGLLHAPAAAAWAEERGETDPDVLAAVRHHPTAHPDWGDVGRVLYVSDFCEPRREHAAAVGADRILARSGEGPEGLAAAALEVLRLRLGWLLEGRRPVHPDSWRAWNAWTGAGVG